MLLNINKIVNEVANLSINIHFLTLFIQKLKAPFIQRELLVEINLTKILSNYCCCLC